MTNPLELPMDSVPVFLAVSRNEQKCSSKGLKLLLLNLLLAQKLCERNNRVSLDAELLRLRRIFVRLVSQCAEEFLNHLVELFENIQDQKIQITQQSFDLIELFNQFLTFFGSLIWEC